MRTRIALSISFIIAIGSLYAVLPSNASTSQSKVVHSATHSPRVAINAFFSGTYDPQRSHAPVTTTSTTVAQVETPATTTAVPSQSDSGPSNGSISPASPDQVAAWSMTATCETGGDWSMQGPVYSGGLGMLNATWIAYGGLAFAPNAGLATPAQQVAVALRIQSNPPDVGGCSGAW